MKRSMYSKKFLKIVGIASLLWVWAATAHAIDLSTTPEPNTPPATPPLFPFPSVSQPPPTTPAPPPPLPQPGAAGSPVTPAPPPGSTAAKLNQGTAQDSGVGLHFAYLQPEIGFGFSYLGSVLPADPTAYNRGAGPVFGLGVGLELLAFQVGARLRMMPTSPFNLWTLGAELQYQTSYGRLWPRIGIEAGYTWLNHWNQDMCGSFCDRMSVTGGYAGIRAGLQYYVTSNIELGVDAALDFLFLKRAAINNVPLGELNNDAFSVGVNALATAHVGIHF